MIENIILDMLTQDSVSVKTINIEGLVHRKLYINSEKGRQQVIQELPVDIQNEIFLVWGNTKTVEEIKIPIDNTPQTPTAEERLSAIEEVMMMLI